MNDMFGRNIQPSFQDGFLLKTQPGVKKPGPMCPYSRPGVKTPGYFQSILSD
jgi:hypothetical protein